MTKIFQVGGSVRDKLLGLPSKDIDYAVETDSFDSMRKHILDNGGRIYLETPQYFTIRAKMPKLGDADFVLCRKDGLYSDGRRPDSVEVGTIYDDLNRRDFSVNAIALDIETGEILDPHDGQKDIRNHIIRCVGDTDTRMREDALRAFRAVRFSITKKFSLSYGLEIYLQSMFPRDFVSVSTERIREELNKMFLFNTPKSFALIFNQFPTLGQLAWERGIWFKPTLESK